MAARFGHKRACLHFYVFVRFCVCLCCQPAPVLQLSIEFKKGVPTKVTLEDGTVETDPVKMWVVCLRRLLRLVVASVAVLAADQRPLLPGAPPSGRNHIPYLRWLSCPTYPAGTTLPLGTHPSLMFTH